MKAICLKEITNMKSNYVNVSLFDISDTFPEISEEEFSQSVIDHQLICGIGFVHGKYRIYKWSQEEHTEQDSKNFLAHEYGLGGWSTDFGFLDHDSKGLTFRKYKRGASLDDEIIKVVSWTEVSNRIQTLIAVDRYLTPDEMKYYKENINQIEILYKPRNKVQDEVDDNDLYRQAIKFYSREITDSSSFTIESELTKIYQKELVYCFENSMSLQDFEEWTEYEEENNIRISYDEYYEISQQQEIEIEL